MSVETIEEMAPSLGVIEAHQVSLSRLETPEANSAPEPLFSGNRQPEDRDLANELRDRIRRRTGSCLIENGRDLLRARDLLKHGLRWPPIVRQPEPSSKV